MAAAARPAPARALLLLQVSVRLVTFVLNQVLVRTTSPSVFGAANVQLELVLSVVLALARDGVRATVMRRRKAQSSVHNLALLPVAVGSVLSVGVGWVYLIYLAPASLRAQGPAFTGSVALYCLGAWLELLAEPLHTYALTLEHYVSLRVAMEASAVLARALLSVHLLHPEGLAWLGRGWHTASPHTRVPTHDALSLVAFALGRAAYGGMLLVTASIGVAYMVSWRTAVATMVPRRHAPLDADTRALVVVTSGQAVLKFVLTEGDKLAVARLTTLEDQGGYALASNYGSLLARTLFQPVEESARLYFSDAMGQESRDARQLHRSAALLHGLFRLHLLLGLVMVTFGPPLAQPMLMLLAGPQWALSVDGRASQASAILATYCYYLPVMGINGVVEAFLQSTAPPAVLARYSQVLICASVGFVAALGVGYSAMATYAPGTGTHSVLVYANLLSLAIRAGVCLRYVARTFEKDPVLAKATRLRAALPSPGVLVALAATAAALRSHAVPVTTSPRTWLAASSPARPLGTTAAVGAATVLIFSYVGLLTSFLYDRGKIRAAFARLR